MSKIYEERSIIYKLPVAQTNDPRRYFINFIDQENANILDVGCACGDFIKALKDEKSVKAWGMEYNQGSIDIAKQTNAFEGIFQVDLNNFNGNNFPQFLGFFDYICFGDVLEHLYNPEDVLEKFKNFLKPSGYFLISLPNIAHASIKANLLLNNFDYTETGILDKTHIRFFTYKTIAKILENLNLKIRDCKFTNWANEFGTQNNDPFKDLPIKVNKFILKDKHSWVVQYIVKCQNNTDTLELYEFNKHILNNVQFDELIKNTQHMVINIFGIKFKFKVKNPKELEPNDSK